MAILLCSVSFNKAQDTLTSAAPITQTTPTAEEHHTDRKLDAGKLIMEHVTDNHAWHLFGHINCPLPVILYNKERGITCFMSNKLRNGRTAVKGYKMDENKMIAVNEFETLPESETTENEEITAATYDISITKNVAALFFSLILMMVIFLSVAKSYTNTRKGLAPKGLQSFIEPIVIFVRDDIAKASIGKKYERYMPFLLTVFFFIWINNMMGLIPIMPGGANVTGNVAITIVLASMTFIITSVTANKAYWQHVFAMPGVPKWVLGILTPIEILGVFLRPFVLMVRLFANITAGHIIILSFMVIIFIFGETNAGLGFGVGIFSLLFSVFMSFLELLVAFLQAYVFTLLSAIYFGIAIAEHDDHH